MASVHSMDDVLAIGPHENSIRVNAVSGGGVETDALRHFPNRAQLLADGREHTLLQRPARPEDIASVVALLCLPEGDWIRGQVLVTDGGYSLLA